MSADNGIYILKTKDQYRVAHFTNSENMYYSAITDTYDNEIVSSRVVELWGDSKFTRKESVALHLAHNWASKLQICEYGVNLIKVNKTWKEITKDAKTYAKREIDIIKKAGTKDYWNMDKLQKIADGYYLSEWLHREQYNKDLREHDCGYWSVCYDKGCKCAIEKNVDGFNNKVYIKMKNEEFDKISFY